MVVLVSFLQFNLLCKIESCFCNAVRTQPEIGSKSAGNYISKEYWKQSWLPVSVGVVQDCTNRLYSSRFKIRRAKKIWGTRQKSTQWYMRVRRVKIKVFKKQLFDDVST
jgi:hypothetical protein